VGATNLPGKPYVHHPTGLERGERNRLRATAEETMSANHRKGNAGEAFVKGLLEKEGYEVIDLAPWFPCDLLGVMPSVHDAAHMPSAAGPDYHHLWAESKVRRSKYEVNRALTGPERKFLRSRLKLGDLVRVYHLIPEKNDTFRIRYLLAGRKALAKTRNRK
jgi:hypothetical protein